MSSGEPVIVACPHCRTHFRAREDQLTVAGGQVRCGICLALFDAGRPESAETPDAEPQVAGEEESSPDAPQPDDGQQRARRILWLSAGPVIAALAFVFQLFVYQFDRWALQPDLRFIYQFACAVIGCELPTPES